MRHKQRQDTKAGAYAHTGHAGVELEVAERAGDRQPKGTPTLSTVARVCPQVRHVGAEEGVAAHQKGSLKATFAQFVVDLARQSYSYL